MLKKGRLFVFICAAIGLFAGFFALLMFPLTPSGFVLEDDWQVIDQAGTSTAVDLPYLVSLQDQPDITLQYRFPAVPGDTLVMRRVSGNAVQVFLNNDEIYRVGNLQEPTANIWNSLLIIPLPHELEPENLLEIKISGISYDVGLTLSPYIDVEHSVQPKALLASLLYDSLLYFSMGAAFIVGVMLIFLSFMRKPGFESELFLGAAAVFATVFCLDYVYRITTGSLEGFLILKKVTMASGYCSVSCFALGLEKLGKGRFYISKYLLIPTFASILVVVLAWDMKILVKAIPFLNIVLLFNLMVVIFLIIKAKRNMDWLIMLAVLLLLSLIQMIALTAIGISYPFVLQYVVLTCALVYGVIMIFEFGQLYRENLELEQRVNRDPLTGVYNRNIFARLNARLHDILVLIDLDNLKHYNDCYGHQAGDELLVNFTSSASSNLRYNDLVIRYGGDEFVLILNSASLEDAERVMKRVLAQFKEANSDDWLGFSYGIDPIFGSLQESLARADARMYCMKKNKKPAPEGGGEQFPSMMVPS